MTIEPFSEMRLFSSLSHFCSLNLISFSEGNWRRRCFELFARVTLWSLVTLGGCAMRMQAYKWNQKQKNVNNENQFIQLISCWSGNQLIHLSFIYISIFVFACTILCKLAQYYASLHAQPQGHKVSHACLRARCLVFNCSYWVMDFVLSPEGPRDETQARVMFKEVCMCQSRTEEHP